MGYSFPKVRRFSSVGSFYNQAPTTATTSVQTIYGGTRTTSTSSGTHESVEDAKALYAAYMAAPVVADGTYTGASRCIPDKYFAPRWAKPGVAYKDARGSQATYSAVARLDMQKICDCVKTPGPLPVFATRVDTCYQSWCASNAQTEAGAPNSQARVDWCWTQYLASDPSFGVQKAGWYTEQTMPASVRAETPTRIPTRLASESKFFQALTGRVRNFPNPCDKGVLAIPAPCSVYAGIDSLYSRRQGFDPTYLGIRVERQPDTPKWMHLAPMMSDRARPLMHSGKLPENADTSSNVLPDRSYQYYRNINEARKYARARTPLQGIGDATTSKTAVALGVVVTSAVVLTGAVYLMTRK